MTDQRDDPVICPHCSHEQPAAVYCARCRVHILHYGAVKRALASFEAGLGQMRTHLQGAAPGPGAVDALRGLGEALRGLKVNVERLSRSQREMTTLSEVGRMINSVLAKDRLLDLIMDLTIKTMFAERGLLMLKDPVTGELAVQAARDMTAEGAGGDKTSRWAISSNICSRVANEGQPILATDAQSEDQFQGMASVMAHNLSSLLCVPIKLKNGEILGVIYVDNRIVSGAFTEDSIELLTGIANQAAIAIENARLYENVQSETAARMSLQRYLSPNVVDDVMKQKEGGMTLGGSKTTCSILFADICGFTPFSQNLDPQQVVGFLNEYFTVMTDIVFQNQGTLDKFIGDAIMAVFGAPVETPDHARHAVKAAIGMQRAAAQLAERRAQEGGKGFQLRIGINSGEVVAGNIGSPSRLEYTVIGDNVNLASRLEPLAGPGGIVISDATYQLVKDLIEMKKLPPVEVKGRTGQVEIYQVLDWVESKTEEDKRNLRSHDRLEVSLFAIYRDTQSSRMYQGSIKNISHGGVQLSTREPFAVNIDLMLSFSLPTGEKLTELVGRIVRAEPLTDDHGKTYYKLGIQFVKCSDTDREKIVAAWRVASKGGASVAK